MPYEYIRHQVNVRITSKTVEVFYHNHRIASHVRFRGVEGQFATVSDYMPENHRHYLEMDGDYFRGWATSIGPNTVVVVNAILTTHNVEKQSHRSCTALMRLADKYSLARLEEACQRALSYTPLPSLKAIQTILKTGQGKMAFAPPVQQKVTKHDAETYGFVRGADYFGGRDDA